MAYRDKEKKRAAKLRYRLRHPEKMNANTKRYQKAHPQRVKDCKARQRRAHPEKHAAEQSRRRARKRGNGVGDPVLIAAFYKRVVTVRTIRCYWCRRSVPKGQREIDHIVPLAKGGPHTEWNLCCACQSCNARKSAKDPFVFSSQGELAFTEGQIPCL